MGDGCASLLAGPPPVADAPQDGADTLTQQVPTQPNGFYDFYGLLPPALQLLPCPVPGCADSFDKLPSLSAHLRKAHAGVQLDAEAEQRRDIARCKVCSLAKLARSTSAD